MFKKGLEVLGIDMDDVTADLSEKVLYYYNLENEKQITRNDLDCWYGNWDIMKDYYLNSNIYGELDVIDGSQEVLKDLNERYNIIFITASPNAESTLEKMSWVDRNFPFVGSQNVISTRHKHLINANLLFDDSPEFIKEFKGIRVLMDAIYNRHLLSNDFDYRVKDWFEFNDVITKLEANGGI